VLCDLINSWMFFCLYVVFPHVTRNSCISHKVSKSYQCSRPDVWKDRAEIVFSTRHALTTYDNTDMSGTKGHGQI
jgi:hypothetical protein